MSAAHLIAAARHALERLQLDRSILYGSAVNRATGEVDDADDRELLDAYSALIVELQAAIESARSAAPQRKKAAR